MQHQGRQFSRVLFEIVHKRKLKIVHKREMWSASQCEVCRVCMHVSRADKRELEIVHKREMPSASECEVCRVCISGMQPSALCNRPQT